MKSCDPIELFLKLLHVVMTITNFSATFRITQGVFHKPEPLLSRGFVGTRRSCHHRPCSLLYLLQCRLQSLHAFLKSGSAYLIPSLIHYLRPLRYTHFEMDVMKHLASFSSFQSLLGSWFGLILLVILRQACYCPSSTVASL